MTKAKPQLQPFKVGDRIRYSGPIYRGPNMSAWAHEDTGRIAEVFPEEKRIKLVCGAQIHFRQVVSRLRPCPRPPKEERVELDLTVMDYGQAGWGLPIPHAGDARPIKNVHLIEKRDGELVLSREEVEKAFFSAAAVKKGQSDWWLATFLDFCKALGFPAKEGK